MDESGNTLKKDTVIQGIKEYQPSETITIDTQAKERAAAKTKADAVHRIEPHLHCIDRLDCTYRQDCIVRDDCLDRQLIYKM